MWGLCDELLFCNALGLHTGVSAAGVASGLHGPGFVRGSGTRVSEQAHSFAAVWVGAGVAQLRSEVVLM